MENIFNDIPLTQLFDIDNNVPIVYIDGGSKGNPGTGICGIYFPDSNRKYNNSSLVCGISYGFYLGDNITNNEAEYEALIAALILARASGIKDIIIFSDSELLVKQINKEYKVKDNKLKLLNAIANTFIDKYDSIKLVHIPREENSKADSIANSAITNNIISVKPIRPSTWKTVDDVRNGITKSIAVIG